MQGLWLVKLNYYDYAVHSNKTDDTNCVDSRDHQGGKSSTGNISCIACRSDATAAVPFARKNDQHRQWQDDEEVIFESGMVKMKRMQVQKLGLVCIFSFSI